MNPKTPSKHFRLDLLRYIQANNYCSENGTEYVACEVDELINEKLERLSESRSVSDVASWASTFKAPPIPPAFPWYLRINPSLERI